jgi:carbonic anhydrase/acetyltransferase-like protein (isoleucine patch superfamily)
MSTPASLKAGPHTTLVLVKKRYLIFYVFLIWISLFSIQFEFWWFWGLYNEKFIHFVLFLPLLLFFMYLSAILISLIFAKILLIIVNLIHKPREGVFLRDRSDKDYRYWSLRSVIKKWPLWISHKFPFPFMDNICLKVFGVKTKFSSSLFEGFIDTEFIEFGKNIAIGQGAIVQSAIIVGNLLIIRKTIIEDNVVIGVHSVVMPGSHLRENSILAGNSLTTVGFQGEKGWIYIGAPAKKFKKNVFFEENLEEIIENQAQKEIKTDLKVEDLYTMRKDKEAINENSDNN